MESFTEERDRHRLQEFWDVWGEHRGFVVGYARTLNLRSGTDADDLVADVLLKGAEAALRGRGPAGDACAWLKALIHNAFVDQYRKLRRRGVPAEFRALEAIADAAPSPEQALSVREGSFIISTRLRALPVRLRTAFELRVLDECSYASIAELQAISGDNARKRVQLALALLRRGGKRPRRARNRLCAGVSRERHVL